MPRRASKNELLTRTPVVWFRTTENEDGTFDVDPVEAVKETPSSLYLLRSSLTSDSMVVMLVKKDSPRRHYWQSYEIARAFVGAQLDLKIDRLRATIDALSRNKQNVVNNLASS